MIQNYLTTAFRNLRKHVFYSLINIVGLSIGLACFILISLYVTDELSYDTFHPDLESIYRMDFKGNLNGNEFDLSLSSVPAAQTLVNEFPEVESAVRLRQVGQRLIKRKDRDQTFKEDLSVFADSNFFQFFNFELVQGNVEEVLKRPNTMAISQTVAKKLFGNEDPVGQEVVIGNNTDYEVTGVFEDMPSRSHMHFDLIFAMEGLDEAKNKIWMSFNFTTYLKLQQGVDASDLNAQFPALVEKYIGPEVEQFMGASMEEFAEAGNAAGFSLFPMKDIHLHSAKLGELEPNGDVSYVYIFSAIAAFILLLACINFMNLATARSASRAKEVGVRKTMGAYRSQLVNQFLAEALMICLVAFALAIGLAAASLPYFENLSDKTLEYSSLFSGAFLGTLLAVIIVVGFLAGSYPAFYLSKFRPVEVLKGKLNLGMKSGGIRSTLVVLQFSVSIIMIVGTAIIFDQLSYIQNKKLGFNKDQVIMVHDAFLMGDKIDAYKTEALRDTRVLSGTVASFLPVQTAHNNNLWFTGQNAGTGNSHVFHNYRIDHDYMETLGLEMAGGRNFSREFPNDTANAILNESAVQQFGFEEPIGEYISTFGGSQQNPVSVTYKVVGVVQNFHFTSLRDKIAPLVFTLGERRGYISFKTEAQNIDATIDFLRNKWDEFAPGQPFEYSFLDERFDDLYTSEQRIGDIATFFAVLSIFIACLGLYGLASFTAEQRTKEIGIRKVLGASITSIIGLLSKEFLKLVGIAFVVAAPLSYYFMNEWLSDFEYRTQLKWSTFAIAGLVSFAIAWLTMSSQSYLAARINPARSLKDE